MKIEPNQVFLDDYDRYEPGQEYEVSLEKGIYFVRNGWADAPEGLPDEQPSEVNLDIHNSTIGMKDSNG